MSWSIPGVGKGEGTPVFTNVQIRGLLQLVSDADGNVSMTVPPASKNNGKHYIVKKSNSSTNTITLNRSGTDTIDGATSFVLYDQYEVARLYSDGVNWYLI